MNSHSDDERRLEEIREHNRLMWGKHTGCVGDDTGFLLAERDKLSADRDAAQKHVEIILQTNLAAEREIQRQAEELAEYHTEVPLLRAKLHEQAALIERAKAEFIQSVNDDTAYMEMKAERDALSAENKALIGNTETIGRMYDMATEALRDALAERDRLRAALSSNPCPAAIPGFDTVGECVAGGKCGCDNAEALKS
jgi:hypothetical protein